MEQPLVHSKYLLQRFPGKGGWTYAELPEIPMDRHAPFGWVCVKGSIDSYHFEQYCLMPMGNGHLFLPVKAAVRRKIGKEAGDWVLITLYPDEVTGSIPEELEACLRDEPLALERFLALSPSARKEHADRIYSAQKPETRADRIARLIDQLLLHNPPGTKSSVHLR